VRARGARAWDRRIRTSALAKARFVSRAFFAAIRRPEEPAEWPQWTRGKLLIAVRMNQPIPPPPMTPLPDEGVQ
jgi:phytoene synthase